MRPTLFKRLKTATHCNACSRLRCLQSLLETEGLSPDDLWSSPIFIFMSILQKIGKCGAHLRVLLSSHVVFTYIPEHDGRKLHAASATAFVQRLAYLCALQVPCCITWQFCELPLDWAKRSGTRGAHGYLVSPQLIAPLAINRAGRQSQMHTSEKTTTEDAHNASTRVLCNWTLYA